MSDKDNSQIDSGKRIYEASVSNDLVVFVGAGVSANSGVSDWQQLTEHFKNALPDSIQSEQDYLKVAELYKNRVPDNEYLNNVRDFLECEGKHFNSIHKAILRLNPAHIITTNFDNFLEEACAELRMPFSVIRSDKHVPKALLSRYLIKMHGDFESGRIVLTEKDYYDYARNYPLIDTLVKSIFSSKTVLFVGFSFNDLNLKIILNSVQSILGADAKPVYLLGDYEEDSIIIDYLKHKGVLPFWLPNEICNQYGEEAPMDLVDERGRAIYRQLSCLKNDVSRPLNILSELYSYAKLVENYMPFFYVTGLNKIVSSKTCSWSITGRGIQLESESLREITNQCKTRDGFRRFLELRGEEYHALIRTAVNNRILSFGPIKLTKIKEFRRCWKSDEKIINGCSLFLDFDYRAIRRRIIELENMERTYSHQDLELPFIKWLLGDLFSAFNLYESLENSYWESNNTFLYFICVFNKYSLLRGSIPINKRFSFNKLESVREKVKDIDMVNILSEMLIDTRIKNNLLDLVNNKYYIDAFSRVNKLMNGILAARFRSENGGFIQNDSIKVLSWELCRSYDYSLVNYLITTNSSCAYETYRNGIIGLINAHFIKPVRSKDGLFAASRLETLEAGHIKLMIFAIDAEDLRNAFNFYGIDSLLLDSDACKYFQGVIDNITRDRRIIGGLLREDILVDKLENILYLYRKVSNKLSRTSKIIDFFICFNLFLHPSLGLFFQNLAYSIIISKEYSLSEEQCRRIISLFPELIEPDSLPSSLVCVVSCRMKMQGWMVDYHNEFRGRKPKLCDIYTFYDIVREDERNEFEKMLQEGIDFKNLVYYDKVLLCMLIADKHLFGFVSPALIDSIGGTSWADNNEPIRRRALIAIFNHSTNKRVKNRIQVIRRFDKHLDFLLSPTRYKGEIEVPWLKEIDDRCFGVLVKRKNIAEAIKQPDADPLVVARYLKCL